MNNTLHTPAPWTIATLDVPNEYASIEAGNEINELVRICDISSWPCAVEEMQANARLISAAPDLLSALEFLLADYIAINGEKLTGSSVPADKAREALRKAKGKA